MLHLLPGDDIEPHPALVAIQPVTPAAFMRASGGLFPPLPYLTAILPAR